MRQLEPYIIPVVLLTFLLSAVYFGLYRNLNNMADKQRVTTIILSALGLSFGLFQVLLNISVQGARNKSQLRYAEYKELGKLLASITELMTFGTSEKLNTFTDVNRLYLTLHGKITDFEGFVATNSNFLFKGLDRKESVKSLHNDLLEIRHHTFDYKTRTDTIEMVYRGENENPEMERMELMSEIVIWLGNLHYSLSNFNKRKYEVLGEVQTYF